MAQWVSKLITGSQFCVGLTPTSPNAEGLSLYEPGWHKNSWPKNIGVTQIIGKCRNVISLRTILILLVGHKMENQRFFKWCPHCWWPTKMVKLPQSKLSFYILFISQGHIGTGPRHSTCVITRPLRTSCTRKFFPFCLPFKGPPPPSVADITFCC